MKQPGAEQAVRAGHEGRAGFFMKRLLTALAALMFLCSLAQADALGLYVVGTLDIGPMTEGDVSAMAALGADLALDVQEV